MPAYAAAMPPWTPQPMTTPLDFDDYCPHCGDALPETRKPYAVYCNRTCAVAYFNALRDEDRRQARAGKTCQCCGATFDGVRSTQIYCSARCSHRMANRAYEARNRKSPSMLRSCRVDLPRIS